MKTIHFVTGATGFVGSNLALELLAQSGTEVYALVRSRGESPQVRLQTALRRAACTAGHGNSLDQVISTRCHAVEGDIQSENCGVRLCSLPRLDQFWHAAASLRFEERYAEEIHRVNVDGTRNALALARRCGLERYFNYISTAYVAGCRTGLIPEDVVFGHETNNHYERSKVRAEMLVSEEKCLATRIYRPSIVIGHSRTHAVASGFTGLYGCMRRALRLSQIMQRLQDGLAEKADLQLYAEPDSRMNLIPVDIVARQMVRISRSNADAKVYHITNPAPPTFGEVACVMFRELDLKPPVFARDTNRFTWLDRKLDEALGFYRFYFRGDRYFERRNTDAVIGCGCEPGYRMDLATLGCYIRWYADVLRKSNAAVPAAA